MNPGELEAALMAKVRSLFASGAIGGSIPERVSIERPKNRDHGDFATSVALQLTKSAGIPPREIAQLLATAFAEIDGVEKTEIAGPGFINLSLVSGAQSAIVKTVLEQGKKYGEGNLLRNSGHPLILVEGRLQSQSG
mgnify:CR=1 FL=1